MLKNLIIFLILFIFPIQSFALTEPVKQIHVTPEIDNTTYNKKININQSSIKKDNLVKGQIHSQNGSPSAKITVKLYEKRLNSEKLLGTTLTDNNGNYQIKYSDNIKSLIIRTYRADTLLTESVTISNPHQIEQIDLTVN